MKNVLLHLFLYVFIVPAPLVIAGKYNGPPRTPSVLQAAFKKYVPACVQEAAAHDKRCQMVVATKMHLQQLQRVRGDVQGKRWQVVFELLPPTPVIPKGGLHVELRFGARATLITAYTYAPDVNEPPLFVLAGKYAAHLHTTVEDFPNSWRVALLQHE